MNSVKCPWRCLKIRSSRMRSAPNTKRFHQRVFESSQSKLGAWRASTLPLTMLSKPSKNKSKLKLKDKLMTQTTKWGLCTLTWGRSTISALLQAQSVVTQGAQLLLSHKVRSLGLPRPRKLSRNCHLPRSGPSTRPRRSHRKSNFKTRIDLKVAQATSTTIQQISFSSKNLNLCGGSNRIASFKRREPMRKPSNSWTNGAKHVQGSRLRFSARKSTRQRQLTLKRREAS